MSHGARRTSIIVLSVRGEARVSCLGGGGLEPRAWQARECDGVQGQSPWSGGQGAEAPMKLKTFWLLDAQRKQQICIILSEP